MQIELLCDADKCAVSTMLSASREYVTVATLQNGHAIVSWYEGAKEAIIAMGDTFASALDRAVKSFAEIYALIEYCPIEPLSKSFMTDYRQHWRENCNNYRKTHQLPLLRRQRCRWRPRESRRELDGLSADFMVIDELHEWI